MSRDPGITTPPHLLTFLLLLHCYRGFYYQNRRRQGKTILGYAQIYFIGRSKNKLEIYFHSILYEYEVNIYLIKCIENFN